MRRLLMLAVLSHVVACTDEGGSSEKQGNGGADPEASGSSNAAPAVCEAGRQVSCACLEGAHGVQRCLADGSGWNECECAGGSGSSGTASTSGAGGEGSGGRGHGGEDASAAAGASVAGSDGSGGSQAGGAPSTMGGRTSVGGGGATGEATAGGGTVPTSGGATGSGGASPTSGGATAGGGTVPTSGGATGSGGASPTSGGATATGGDGGDGTGGDGTAGFGGQGATTTDGVDCTAASGVGLPLNETLWIDGSCDTAGIQGGWGCVDDESQDSSCSDSAVPRFQNGAVCLAGTSVDDPGSSSWGGLILLTLNETRYGGLSSVGPYDATANGVVGFRITAVGDSLGQSLRVGFANDWNPDVSAPFVEVGEVLAGAPRTFDVLIEDARVPEDSEAANAGEQADPAAIYKLMIQYPGGEANGEYEFCVTSIEPMMAEEAATVHCDVSGLTEYGSTSERYGMVDAGSYVVQNNLLQETGASQTLTVYDGGDASVAFRVSPEIFGSGSAVVSCPSAIYGWSYGTFYGDYTTAMRLSDIRRVPASLEYCTPAQGTYNASYRMWIDDRATPSLPGGATTEVMVWLSDRDATPIGTLVGFAAAAGTTWEVWEGANTGGWSTVSYRRVTATPSATFDLMDFVLEGARREYFSMDDYLLGVEAGFEIGSGTEDFTVQRCSVSIE